MGKSPLLVSVIGDGGSPQPRLNPPWSLADRCGGNCPPAQEAPVAHAPKSTSLGTCPDVDSPVLAPRHSIAGQQSSHPATSSLACSSFPGHTYPALGCPGVQLQKGNCRAWSVVWCLKYYTGTSKRCRLKIPLEKGHLEPGSSAPWDNILTVQLLGFSCRQVLKQSATH